MKEQTINLGKVEEVIQGKVTSFGTGAHIVVPQKHLGKKVLIFVQKEKMQLDTPYVDLGTGRFRKEDAIIKK